MTRGSTYRRRKADGTWSRWIAVIDGPRRPDEARRQITRVFDTRRQAQDWLAQQVRGTDESSQAPLMRDWLGSWLTEQPFTKPTTLATYRSHVDRYFVPYFGTIPVAQLTRAHVADLAAQLASTDLAPATVHRIMATLLSAMGAAVRADLITVNPVTGARLPRIPARPHSVWTVEEASAFLEQCGSDGIGVLFRTALMTGMRRGELLGLTWPNIDMPGGALLVQSARVAMGGEVVTTGPKSRFGVRRIYLDSRTIEALRVWRLSQTRCLAANDGLVFTHESGTPFQPWWVSRAFDRLVTDLSLPRIRFHDLRHTSATLGLTAGESLKEVSSRLGHADIGITANVYGDVLPQTARASSSRRSELLHSVIQPMEQAAS